MMGGARGVGGMSARASTTAVISNLVWRPAQVKAEADVTLGYKRAKTGIDSVLPDFGSLLDRPREFNQGFKFRGGSPGID
jgi:hypothetical protein